MKIICIGQNYLEHIKELHSAIPTEPVFFLKPDTALVTDNQSFYLPDFSKDIHYEAEVIIKIHKAGKYIDEKFAHKYYDELSVGIDFTARDIQKEQKTKGLPWEKAKAFDHSAPVGRFISKSKLPALNNLNFHLNINNQTVQKGNTHDLLFSFDKIISFVSHYISLRTGDILFTGTPVGVGPVHIGDTLEAYLENEKVLCFEVK
jgi:acylpyruvate hydrolase